MKGDSPSRFFVVLGALTAVGLAGLGYLLAGAHANYSVAANRYQTLSQELKRLQTLPAYPDVQNLQKMRVQTDAYREEVRGLFQRMTEMNFPKQEANPNEFQDRLRKAVTALVDRAAKSGTELPSDFYFGFQQYKDKLPAKEQSSALARELKSAEVLAQLLTDARVAKISEFKLQEPVRPAPVAQPGTKGPPGAKNPAAQPPPDPSQDQAGSQKVLVTFLADPASLKMVMNGFVRSKQFFLIRTLRVKNEKDRGPLRVAAVAEETPAPTGGEAPSAVLRPGEKPDKLEFIFGREKVEVSLLVEIVNFPAPGAIPALVLKDKQNR